MSPSGTMNHVERFRAVMNFQPVDRLPRWEWAMWWDAHHRPLARGRLAPDAAIQPGFRHRAVLRPRSVSAVLVQHDRGHDRSDAASRRRHRREHGRLPADSAATLSRPRARHRRDAALGRAAGAGRGRRLGDAGRLLLVSAHADEYREAQLRVLRSAGAGPRDQPGPPGVQPAAPGPDGPRLRADLHDARRGHELQPRAR